MTDPVWEFCESSKPLLQRCIDAASKNNKNSNKWLKHFTIIKNTPEIIDNNGNVEKMAVDEEITTVLQTTVEHQEIQQGDQEKGTEESCEFLFSEELKDLDPVNDFGELMEKCLQNTKTFHYLAANLPFSAIERLCNHIFSVENVNAIFIEHFYKLFLPELLKRDNTSLILDFLVKAKKFSNYFNKLLFIIICDMEIPKHVLTEYSSTLDVKEKFELLKYLSQNVTKDVFRQHLHTIHLLYKECDISEDIQRYILQNIKQIHQSCSNDKNFGKFLLNYLQIHKKFSINCSDLTNIVECHVSVFKKPCINALNDIKKVQSLSQY